MCFYCAVGKVLYQYVSKAVCELPKNTLIDIWPPSPFPLARPLSWPGCGEFWQTALPRGIDSNHGGGGPFNCLESLPKRQGHNQTMRGLDQPARGPTNQTISTTTQLIFPTNQRWTPPSDHGVPQPKLEIWTNQLGDPQSPQGNNQPTSWFSLPCSLDQSTDALPIIGAIQLDQS
jgi:hypothetical protein